MWTLPCLCDIFIQAASLSTKTLHKGLSYRFTIPRHPVILSEIDWGVQSPPQHSILVPLPFSEGDWIPRVYHI